jgi:hypothetical protein
MHRSRQFCAGVLLLIAVSLPVNGQGAKDLDRLLDSSQFDLAAGGREFLSGQVSRASFLLVGGLHGDNETQALFQSMMPSLGEGPTLVVTEMSPWAAGRLSAAIPDSAGVRLRGVDIEASQLPRLIREIAAANPESRPLQDMLALVKDGYQRTLASDLLLLAHRIGDVKDSSPGGVPLAVLLTRTLEVEADRSRPETADLQASVRRERVMKDFFLTHYRAAAGAGAKPKVAAVFGRNHLHRGIDRRGVSTLGNFITEFATAEGAETFNVALFAAGGKVALGGVREFDERSADPAFGHLASVARYSATVFDMKPLREPLQKIPAAVRTPVQQSLLYWANSYDAVVCYREVTPTKQ